MSKRRSDNSGTPQSAAEVQNTKRRKGNSTDTGSIKENDDNATTPLLISSLKNPKKPSILEQGTHLEIVDTDILEKIVNSDVLKRRGSVEDAGEIWELRKFFNLVDESIQLTKIRDAKGQVSYNGSPTGYGRVFAEKGLSIALLRKRIRHTLCANIYIDCLRFFPDCTP